jgi:hypothetical protein
VSEIIEAEDLSFAGERELGIEGGPVDLVAEFGTGAAGCR